MKDLFHNNRNNQTEITDTKLLKMIWLGIVNDYRTLIGVDDDGSDVKSDTDDVCLENAH